MSRSDPLTMQRARELRKRMTPAEIKLWSGLRKKQLRGVRFRRQHAIGRCIVDFCAPLRRLVIEVDGIQHADHEEYDERRTAFLEGQGYTVIRFWNSQVMHDLAFVLSVIDQTLQEIE